MLLKDILMWSFTSSVLLFITVGPILVGRRQEKRNWNKGICPVCGKPWMLYDTYSHGGRMYRCENWHRCDVSYRVDK